MQARSREGAIQGLTAKTRAPKKVNHTRAVQMAFLLVQKMSRRPNFLANVSFARKQDIKLQISGKSSPAAFVWVI